MKDCPNEALAFKSIPVSEAGGLVVTCNILHRKNNQQVTQIGRYIHNCCGAGEIAGLYGSLNPASGMYDRADVAFDEKALQRQREDFLCTLLRCQGHFKTYSFIVTDSQQSQYGSKTSFMAFLLELGAKQVDDTPNQVHGPHKMLLHVWSPNLNKDALKKYVTLRESGVFDLKTDRYLSTDYNPLWWVNSTDAEREAILKQYPEKTSLQLAEEEEAKRTAAQKLRLVQEKAVFQRHCYYHPEWLKEEGYQKLTAAQQMLLDEASNKVVTKARNDMGRFISSFPKA